MEKIDGNNNTTLGIQKEPAGAGKSKSGSFSIYLLLPFLLLVFVVVLIFFFLMPYTSAKKSLEDLQSTYEQKKTIYNTKLVDVKKNRNS